MHTLVHDRWTNSNSRENHMEKPISPQESCTHQRDSDSFSVMFDVSQHWIAHQVQYPLKPYNTFVDYCPLLISPFKYYCVEIYY